MCRKGEYGIVCADGVRENIWASSDSAGFFEKLLKWQADIGGESMKCATFKTQAAEAAKLRVFVGMANGDAELIFSLYIKIHLVGVLATAAAYNEGWSEEIYGEAEKVVEN